MPKASLITIWMPAKTEYRDDAGNLIATATYIGGAGYDFREEGPIGFIGDKRVASIETCEWLALAIKAEMNASGH